MILAVVIGLHLHAILNLLTLRGYRGNDADSRNRTHGTQRKSAPLEHEETGVGFGHTESLLRIPFFLFCAPSSGHGPEVGYFEGFAKGWIFKIVFGSPTSPLGDRWFRGKAKIQKTLFPLGRGLPLPLPLPVDPGRHTLTASKYKKAPQSERM